MPDFKLVSEFKATGDQPQAIDRLRWRMPDLLGTSGRPGRDKGRQHNPNIQDVETWVRTAQGMGFQTVICFPEDRKLEKWYGEIHPHGLLGYYRNKGLTVCHLPAEDYQPVPEDVKRRAFDAFARVPKPVILQDSGGADRTGAVAKYIIRQLPDESRNA